MNHIIKQLAEKAGMNIKTNISGVGLVFGTFEGNKTLHITTEELEKFTELIVKECCEVADLARECFDVANDGNEDEYLGTTAGIKKFAERIVRECCKVADLARECFDVANDGNGNEYLGTTADIKKFAELIVRECCKVADELHLYLPSMTAKKLIVRYFGVEP